MDQLMITIVDNLNGLVWTGYLLVELDGIIEVVDLVPVTVDDQTRVSESIYKKLRKIWWELPVGEREEELLGGKEGLKHGLLDGVTDELALEFY